MLGAVVDDADQTHAVTGGLKFSSTIRASSSAVTPAMYSSVILCTAR